MISREDVQNDLDAIFNHLVESGMLGSYRKFLEQGHGQTYSNTLRLGQLFIFNMSKFLQEYDYNFPTPNLFHCTDREMVDELIGKFIVKCYEEG